VTGNRLKTLLNRLYAARSQEYLANDPLSFCHRYPDPADREVVGLLASAFAYGQVKIILNNLGKIFGVMGDSPRRFVERFAPERELARFAGFKHRFNDGRDLCALLLAIRTMLEEADTIGEFFLAGYDPAAPDITTALNSFSASVLAMDYAPVFGSAAIPADSYFPFLFPSPASGSACKRLCMYLRWMVRPADGIDLGLWPTISPARLVIPVDAHIQRIGRFLGFTGRRQADWKMAQEITAALRRLDPADPVKYDFSLAHLGISAGCDGTNRQACLTCTIAGICSGKPP
jgi:uncharacterized protein (TIGR02757 family)